MSLVSSLKRLVPPTLRHRLDSLLRPLLALPRGVLILLGERPQGKAPHIFYGHGRIPKPEHQTYGGMVKFQRMQEEFPNSPHRFNILYMVSSRMPYGGEQIAWFARKKGVRVVWNQNGVAYPGWHPVGWRQINAPMARIHADADYVFYQSEFCRQSAEQFLGTRRGTSEILHNAVDTTVFTPAAADPTPGSLVMLLGGTQYQWYRLESAFQTLARLRGQGVNVRLLVTGRLCWISDEAIAVRQARELVSQLGLDTDVEFLGPYTQADAPSIFRRAHVLLHTKVNDPCPGLVVEAMACGLPVVYSQSGGVPELVGAEGGIGVPDESNWERDIPPDPTALAQAVLTVAGRREMYARAARQRAVKRFDLKPWLERHRQVFDAVLQ